MMMKRKMAILVSMMMVASAGTVLAWGPNDPTDARADPDGDRLGNLKEFRLGTNPLKPDTDGGGCWDGWEFLYGLDPTVAEDDLYDTDGDGWTNLREFLEGTDPTNPNTDGDCFEWDPTDPHPLVPDGEGPVKDPGIGPGPGPGPDWPINPPKPNPMPGPHRPWPGPVKPGPVLPPSPPDDRDSDHDGLVEFIESM